MEFDDRLLHQRNVGRENSRGSAVALDEDNDEDEEGGSAGPHDDGGNEADVEVGDDNMQDRGALADADADTPMHGHDISPAGAVGAARGQPSTSRGISLSQSRSKGGHDSHAMQGPKAKKRIRETSPSASTHKRQARTDAVNEAREALTASQEARPPRKNSQGGRSGGQGSGCGGGGRGGARKGSQRVRPQELQDSGDEGEGVDPRMPKDADEPVQRVVPIDTTRYFFLEYDDQGFATQDVYALRVDVMRIKRIPRGMILFNHRSLFENIVRGIENVIESSISTDPGAWDRPELVLAPVDRNDIVGSQGRRITPTEFLERDPAEFDRYAVCGQHTVEAMKRLVRKDSPTVKVYGLNAYSKVLPPRVNTECLLDIMRKEQYMVRMFNYVLFRAEGRADDEWNDVFFMSYKDLEDRYGPNGLCVAEWEKERDKLHVNKVKMVPQQLGGVEEARQGNNVIACDESAKDIAYLTKFVDILVKDERFACHVKKPRCKHRSNRDMFHKLGCKRLKVWEYLFRDAPQGRLDGNYIYRKAKVTKTLKHYHGALTSAFETFVARCEILKFDLHKDQLTSKDYANLAKSGDDFNPIDSEEDSSESDLESGENKGGEGLGGGMVRSHDKGTVRSYERPVPVAAHSVGSMVAPMEGTGLPNMGICGPNDDDDIDMPGEASKLAPGDPILPGYCADPTTIYFLGGKHVRTGATYESLLLTCAALEGTSEMQSESGVGLSVSDSQLQPELCTGKGDAQSPLTPQGGAAADGGKGGDVEGIFHPRNLETLTDDFDYGGESGNDVVNTRGV
ncbi:hypothetical protein CBR_g28686 [Chara braunii]|uniref:Uncharacterized protein n=1 Tax=Chara braunii TaxID=69332 RepID=A0A388L9R7_CHABU|nr:hypothetical protein CBR_g28686 [Chara braunii]|eukprot:GBG78972.1 hypothetical protein CBR_g28686 [Chara braunii]